MAAKGSGEDGKMEGISLFRGIEACRNPESLSHFSSARSLVHLSGDQVEEPGFIGRFRSRNKASENQPMGAIV